MTTILPTSDFYKNAASYWANVPATVDGVLGGYGYISNIDIEGSKAFLKKILAFNNPPDTKLALDCGAGIGRISKYLLTPCFNRVDLVEQDEKFLSTVRKFIGKNNTKIGRLYKSSLQNFIPEKEYDMIWCQWVLGHLKDDDLVAFLERSAKALKNNGVIVVKENIAIGNDFEFDDVDSSVTRPCILMEKIFGAANLKIVTTEIQRGFPTQIYPVYSYALVPQEYSLASA